MLVCYFLFIYFYKDRLYLKRVLTLLTEIIYENDDDDGDDEEMNEQKTWLLVTIHFNLYLKQFIKFENK